MIFGIFGKEARQQLLCSSREDRKTRRKSASHFVDFYYLCWPHGGSENLVYYLFCVYIYIYIYIFFLKNESKIWVYWIFWI